MAVQVATLDILIQRAHLDPEIARAMGDAIDMELSISRETLATKQDISELNHATKQHITELNHATKQHITELSHATQQDISELSHATQQHITELRHATKHDIDEIKIALTQEYAKGKYDLIRWMLATMLTVMSLMFGLIYFVVQHVP